MNTDIGKYECGETLDSSHNRNPRRVFKMKGLNRKTKTGVYATVEYGKEDWFHADFDEKHISIERQYALFDMFKNTEDNLWSGKDHRVAVLADGYRDDRRPVNPLIVELFLDNL
jgi:hypothetical protein